MTTIHHPRSAFAPLRFSRTQPVPADTIEQPTNDEIKATPSLWQAPLDDAIRYGGDLTRAALGAMRLRGDRRYVVVDSKVHMLMPGFYPAIPGWHTDGVPRGPDLHPQAKAPPNIWAQEELERGPRFHLLVTGEGCLTQFAWEPISLDVPCDPSPDLYRLITEQIAGLEATDPLAVRPVESCRAYEWDWWNLHTAQAALLHEWRFLVRVTESDVNEPQTDLRKIIRNQQQVYVPEAFGW